MDQASDSRDRQRSDESDTDRLIRDARRPVIIQRHRDLVAEMENTITDGMLSDESDHARADELREQLADPQIGQAVAELLHDMQDPELHDRDALRDALIDELCMQREDRDRAVADLQLIAIACYRRILAVIAERLGTTCDCETLRMLPAKDTARLALGDDSAATGIRMELEDIQRPASIAKHRDLIEDVESAITDNLVTGTTEHPRLKKMLVELDSDSEQARIRNTLDTISGHPRLGRLPLRDALLEELCLLRERGVEMATLQLHVIGIYRRVRSMMNAQHGLVPDLEDLRTLTSGRIARLLEPQPIVFGDPSMADALVVTQRQLAQALADVKEMSRSEGGDQDWNEAGGRPPLPRELEEPLLALPEAERKAKRESLISERIRSDFYRSVFLGYFDRDTLGDEEIGAHQTILTWLQGMRETPHLYPYLQGQTTEQKLWRLSRLLHKIVRLNELYQRIGKALDVPELRDELRHLSTRERLQVLSRERFPALSIGGTFAVITMLCPFEVFARWIQQRVADNDLVLPPDPS